MALTLNASRNWACEAICFCDMDSASPFPIGSESGAVTVAGCLITKADFNGRSCRDSTGWLKLAVLWFPRGRITIINSMTVTFVCFIVTAFPHFLPRAVSEK